MAGKKIETVDDLPGIGETAATKLREAGIRSLEAMAMASPKELIDAGIGEGTAQKAIYAARDALDIGFETADKVMERRSIVQKLTTGSKTLDSLIGGGLETQAMTEAYGKFGSSKTQLGFQLCVNVQLPVEKGGLDGAVLFIDTENTFRPERIVQLAKAKGLDPQEVLKKIFVARAYNADHQMVLIENSNEMIEQNKIKLIIIDSLTSRFRSDFIGRGTLADRQQKLNKHLHYLQKLADIYDLAIYVTNQVMDNPGLMFGDPTTPIGGHILGHQSAYRLYLRKSKEEKRIARLVDSPCMPEGEVIYRVTEIGIEDVDE